VVRERAGQSIVKLFSERGLALALASDVINRSLPGISTLGLMQ
jgi:hypothetical protein